MKKNLFASLVLFLMCGAAFTQSKKVVCSTSWSAAFADIAGCDKTEVIAPVNLKHPPEYEITVSDIKKVQDADYFVYAGFERMMKTLGDSCGKAQMLKITLDNSYETVASESLKLAQVLGTEKIQKKRLAEYKAALDKGKAKVLKSKKQDLKVYCNKNQIYLAKELGFTNIQIFGPAPLTSSQLAQAKKENFDLVIDNVHNPVADPLKDILPDAAFVVWRNFPETTGRGSLVKVIEENIKALDLD